MSGRAPTTSNAGGRWAEPRAAWAIARKELQIAKRYPLQLSNEVLQPLYQFLLPSLLLGATFFVAFGTQMFTFTRAKDATKANDVPELLRRYFSKVPGMFAITMQRSIFSSGISGSRGLDLDIIGTDYPTITGIAFEAFI